MVCKACPSATFSHTNLLTISDVSSGMDFPKRMHQKDFGILVVASFTVSVSLILSGIGWSLRQL